MYMCLVVLLEHTVVVLCYIFEQLLCSMFPGGEFEGKNERVVWSNQEHYSLCQ